VRDSIALATGHVKAEEEMAGTAILCRGSDTFEYDGQLLSKGQLIHQLENDAKLVRRRYAEILRSLEAMQPAGGLKRYHRALVRHIKLIQALREAQLDYYRTGDAKTLDPKIFGAHPPADCQAFVPLSSLPDDATRLQRWDALKQQSCTAGETVEARRQACLASVQASRDAMTITQCTAENPILVDWYACTLDHFEDPDLAALQKAASQTLKRLFQDVKCHCQKAE
jgi:hypothetical protein